ncbi:MAG: ATP-binding protein [bacterium]|nr:ATP-binding protein [bacterium]
MKNNWYVVTGASCSGKTTITEALKEMGYKIVPETARALIESEQAGGLTVQEIRKDEKDFQRRVLQMKIDIESSLDPNGLVFLDRAIPDTVAYDKLYGVEDNKLLEGSLKMVSYKKVFVLEQLPYSLDEVRIESEEQQKMLHTLLRQAYKDLEMEIIDVPAIPIKERVELILNNL